MDHEEYRRLASQDMSAMTTEERRRHVDELCRVGRMVQASMNVRPTRSPIPVQSPLPKRYSPPIDYSI